MRAISSYGRSWTSASTRAIRKSSGDLRERGAGIERAGDGVRVVAHGRPRLRRPVAVSVARRIACSIGRRSLAPSSS